MAESESARATTAAEARFRVRDPNSTPRAMMVVALDPPAAALAEALAGRDWRRVNFSRALGSPPGALSPGETGLSSWLATIADEAAGLTDEVGRVDIVQMLASVGHDAPAAALIGDACFARGIKTSGIIIDDPAAEPEALTRSLRALRPWVMTLSVIGSADDVDEILHALGG